ncbi:MAG: hypothetical protein KDJ16_15700 [Hyphomicrobiales bacterium]|nr:hypothetical protein [Hyphomicrobiales bacterium]
MLKGLKCTAGKALVVGTVAAVAVATLITAATMAYAIYIGTPVVPH